MSMTVVGEGHSPDPGMRTVMRHRRVGVQSGILDIERKPCLADSFDHRTQ